MSNTASGGLPNKKGQQLSSQSSPVVLASDQTVNVNGNITLAPGDRVHEYCRGDASGTLPITYVKYTVPTGKALDIENWHFSGEGKGLMVMDIDDGTTEYEIDAIRTESSSSQDDRNTGWFGINTPLRICAGSIVRLRLRERNSSNKEYITGFNAVLRNVTSCTNGAIGGQPSGDDGVDGGEGDD